MKYLYISWDGAGDPYLETLFWPIFSRIQGLLFDVLHISPRDPSADTRIKQQITNSGGTYHKINIPEGARWWSAPVAVLLAVIELRKIAQETHYHGFIARSSLPALILRLSCAMREQTRFVFDADGFMQDERAEFASWKKSLLPYQTLRRAENWAVSRADAVLTRSEWAKKIICRRNKQEIRADKIFTVVNGRDEKEFYPEETNFKNDAPLIVFAGSVGPQYCIKEMLDFFSEVKKRYPQAAFHFFTTIPEKARTFLESIGVFPSNLIIKHLQGSALSSAIRLANLGLALRMPYPSMQAVCPIKCGEYLLSGVPVLMVEKTGDLEKKLVDSPACKFIPNIEKRSLADAADWFCQEIYPHQKLMRCEARRIGLAHFTLEKTIDVYQQAIDFAQKNFRKADSSHQYQKKGRVLYFSHDGMLEPLGQSQVVAYLEGLAARWDIEIFSFEKAEDLACRKKVDAMFSRLDWQGIRWHIRKYRNSPKHIAQLLGFAGLVASCWIRNIYKKPWILHARSYPAMAASLVAFPGSSIKKIFDMRGFWADEKVQAGSWKKNSLIFRITKMAEKIFLRKSDQIITLTRVAAAILQDKGIPAARIRTLSTCVDLTKFGAKDSPPRAGGAVLCLSGNLSGWYCRNEMFGSAKIFLETFANSRLLVLSGESKEALSADLHSIGLDKSRWSHEKLEYSDMPAYLKAVSLGLFLSIPSFSELGRAPTKMAEFLACGVPVVTNLGLGDAPRIVMEEKVGIVLDEPTAACFAGQLEAIRDLLKDSQTRFRCRRTAEKYFDLNVGIESYEKIYRELCFNPIKNQN